MTETSHAVPHHHDHFTAACRQQQQSVEAQVVQQQQQQQQAQDGAVRRSPPRCAVHGNETFIGKGTSAADLAALFPKRDLF